MTVEPAVRNLIEKKGLLQVWVVDQMNRVDPDLNMSKTKFSAIVCGSRKMTGDELLAFCKATGTNPEYFFDMAIRDSA